MGKRGPAPAATVTKLRAGVSEDRINRDEPVPGDGDVSRPEWLSERAAEVWDRLAPDLQAKGVLTPWDVDAFATLCHLIVINRQALEHVVEHGSFVSMVERELADGTQVLRVSKNPAWQVARDSTSSITTLGGRFGLNPSDRSQLNVGAPGATPAAAAGAARLLS